MRKILLTLIMVMMMIGLASASLGTFKLDDCINIRTVLNATEANISSISYPNSTVLYINDVMTANGKTFNYTFCDATIVGNYIYDYCDITNDECWVNDFDITYSGNEFNQQTSTMYIVIVSVLIFLFLLAIFGASRLPSGDSRDEDGAILQVNNLKYFRPVLFGLAWLIVIAMIFIMANMGLGYMYNTGVGQFFFSIYQILFWTTIVLMAPIFIIYLYTKVMHDKAIKELIERGITPTP